MNSYETSATVDEQGRVLITGVPFAPGTEVDITITPKRQSEDERTSSDDPILVAARARMRKLFGTIKEFRNSPQIPREKLNDRGSLH
jgi:hypothetical protein